MLGLFFLIIDYRSFRRQGHVMMRLRLNVNMEYRDSLSWWIYASNPHAAATRPSTLTYPPFPRHVCSLPKRLPTLYRPVSPGRQRSSFR